jgi:LmbE family N-acetylglucosaminyl deacetylase
MKNNTILFIYAHMDDETILSYGTIKKLSINNKVCIATLCGISRNKNTGFERDSVY